jgi:hypothetical protein
MSRMALETIRSVNKIKINQINQIKSNKNNYITETYLDYYKKKHYASQAFPFLLAQISCDLRELSLSGSILRLARIGSAFEGLRVRYNLEDPNKIFYYRLHFYSFFREAHIDWEPGEREDNEE